MRLPHARRLLSFALSQTVWRLSRCVICPSFIQMPSHCPSLVQIFPPVPTFSNTLGPRPSTTKLQHKSHLYFHFRQNSTMSLHLINYSQHKSTMCNIKEERKTSNQTARICKLGVWRVSAGDRRGQEMITCGYYQTCNAQKALLNSEK